MRRVSRLGSASVLFLFAACGGGGDGGTGPGGGGGGGGGNCAANTICMTGSTFNPTSRTVAANAALTWTNDSGIEHNVTFDTPASALGVGGGSGGNFGAASPSTNQRSFAAAGTYPFHCTIHGNASSGMRGSVVVQ